MPKFSFQKLFKKSEVRGLLEQLQQSLAGDFAIFDDQDRCVWGQPDQSGTEVVLHCHGQIVGTMRTSLSHSAQTAIAQILTYIVQTEYEKKQLAQDTLEKYEEVVFLSQFAHQIATCTNLKELLMTVRVQISQAMAVDEVFLFLYDQIKQELSPFIYKTEASLKNFQAIEHIVQRVLKVNRVEVIDDICQDRDYIEDCEECSPIRSLLCASLTVQNSIIGVLGLTHRQPKHFTSADLNLFATITGQVAAAIQTTQYYDTIKNYSQTLEARVRERTMELEYAKEQLEQVNQKLKHLAVYDELTQIPNRRYFINYLEQEWRQCVREQLPLSIILCDVDHFKNYNDFYGHQVGDDCLRQIAQIVQSCLKRPSDILSRYGGEEFVLILPYTDQMGALTVADRIHHSLAIAAIPHGNSPTGERITVSLGIGTVVPQLHHQSSDLIKIADQALYAAKAEGRNQTRVKTLCLQTN